ncbi:uncharacterized protein LOC129730333 [Wyeomyia smithii]|uniref:uncharacterized protein LOC129730333 n=1 Tax=Wyeomyia smithii TaxID=174621 RepID=UPI00246818CA|nr:uncharacterized protein LOC129730333 [Wyeomyia smithii]
MSYWLSSLLALLSVCTILVSQYTEEAVNYKFCVCPCEHLLTLNVKQYFTGDANCVMMRNTYFNGFTFVNEDNPGGQRAVHHDIKHVTVKPMVVPFNYAWRIFYPWWNISSVTRKIPVVIQNIMTQEFMRTSGTINVSIRLVVTTATLSYDSLWEPSNFANRYLFKHVKSNRWLTAHQHYKDRWDRGQMGIDLIGDNRSSEYDDVFQFRTQSCYI